MSDLPPHEPTPPTYACPACGQTMALLPDQPNLLICPVCQCESFMPEAEAPVAEEPAPAPLPHEDELSAVRIRRLATERRSINRTASYFIVAAGVCLVAIGQLIWMTTQHVRALGWTPRPIGYLLFILLATWGAWRFGRRAISLHRRAKQAMMPQPMTPPDFSTLDDGSKHWKNLEDVR